ARRLACRRAQLALRPGLAVRRHGPCLSGLSGALRRGALSPVPAPGSATRMGDAALLPAPTEGAPSAGEAQRTPEAGLHGYRAPRGRPHAERIRHLQAGAARLGHRPLRWLWACPLLALRDGLGVRWFSL